MRLIRAAVKKSRAYRAGYMYAKLSDQEGMPLDISIRDVVLTGSIALTILVIIYKLGGLN